MRRFARVTALLILPLVALPLAAEEAAQPPAAARQLDFRADVYPLLAARCFQCHAGADNEAGVRLDVLDEILGESTGHPLVVPGDSAASRLIELVAAAGKEVMPPEGERLSAEEIGLLRTWIDQGVAWDNTLLPPPPTESDHWAFQPVERPAVPNITAEASPLNNPLDAFLEAARRQHGVSAAPQAERRTLIRRLYLSAMGLPPSTDEVEEFLADAAPDAYERLLDRVLASPHYGERLARQWLDLARYAETEGYESNHPRPHAWRYRDYVVGAFNRDKPYDEFVRQQLAGDEIEPYSDENLVATGFLAAARISSNEEDKWLQRYQVLVDVVNATSQSFLGLTVNCAQCHNHKFDPVSARDYYRLMGFFVTGQPLPIELQSAAARDAFAAPPEYEPALKLKQAIFEAAVKRREQAMLEKLSAEERDAATTPPARRTREQELTARRVSTLMQPSANEIERHIPEADKRLYDEAKKKVAEIEKQGIAIPQAWAFYSPATSPHRPHVLPQIGFYPLPYDRQELVQYQSFIAVRGDVNSIGPQVEPGWPAVLERVQGSGFRVQQDQPRKRLDLAAWLTDRSHPLTARVWVNRLWQYQLGVGIVASSGDFGVQGDRPSHPELLDWLAAELMDRGWSNKHIDRLILSSHAFRQGSRADPTAAEHDPENRYLSHFAPRRLAAETLRDAMLAASGELDCQLGGPSMQKPDDPAVMRRSLYLLQKRGVPPELQKLFDGPAEMAESCTQRHVSTTALQSLYLLNNPLVVARAEALAAELVRACGGDREAAIVAAFKRVLCRPPDDDELAACLDLLAAQPANADPARGLVLVCQALLNTNELAYLD